MNELKITSSAFKHNEKIPSKYSCEGEDINPPLDIDGIPKETESLVLIVDDPDAPIGTWDHWVVWNIVVAIIEGVEGGNNLVTIKIRENTVPGIEGLNSFGKHSYGGPCPPSGTHRYFFKVYALNKMLELDQNSKKVDVEKAMEGSILAKGELVGLYNIG